MAKATDNSQFSVSQLQTFSSWGHMWYDWDWDASAYNCEEIDYVWNGVLCRTAVYLGTEGAFLRNIREFDPFDSYKHTPVLAGPSPAYQRG